MAFRAVCLTGNSNLRRTISRTLQAAGAAVDFIEDAAALTSSGTTRVDLIVVDAAEHDGVDPAFLAAPVVAVAQSLSPDQIFSLLHRTGLNHVIADLVPPNEDQLIVTSTKLLRGDLFGLEKYLAWGVQVREREVATYEDKRNALLEVSDYARDVGARRHTCVKIEAVADELLMNALYDAPALRYGTTPTAPRRPIGEEPALLRYACDGRTFAVSVRDEYGELKKESLLAHLDRARAERGRPRTHSAIPAGTPAAGAAGAGLGIYFIVNSATRFIANVLPGQQSEVICLFDLRASGREESAARAMHVFVGLPST